MSNYFDSEGGAGSAMEMTTAGDGNEQWRLNLFMCGGVGDGGVEMIFGSILFTLELGEEVTQFFPPLSEAPWCWSYFM